MSRQRRPRQKKNSIPLFDRLLIGMASLAFKRQSFESAVIRLESLSFYQSVMLCEVSVVNISFWTSSKEDRFV